MNLSVGIFALNSPVGLLRKLNLESGFVFSIGFYFNSPTYSFARAPGKKTDLQLVELRSPHIMPTADITSSLVLYGSTANVDTVMVDGKIVKDDGEIVFADMGEAMSEAQALTDEIWDNLFRVHPELEKLAKG